MFGNKFLIVVGISKFKFVEYIGLVRNFFIVLLEDFLNLKLLVLIDVMGNYIKVIFENLYKVGMFKSFKVSDNKISNIFEFFGEN